MTSNAPKLQLKVNNHLWEDIPEMLEVDQSSNSIVISQVMIRVTLFKTKLLDLALDQSVDSIYKAFFFKLSSVLSLQFLNFVHRVLA